MFNIIFPIIIFLSLGVIIFIVGKHLPEFIDIKKQKEETGGIKNTTNNFLKLLFLKVKNIFKWILGKSISKVTKFLSLIQAWVSSSEKEIAQTNKTVKSDKNDFFEKITQTPVEIKTEVQSEESDLTAEKMEIDVNPVVKKKFGNNLFSNFKNNLRDKILEKKRKKIKEVFQETDEDTSRYSDGIVKIHDKLSDNKIQEKSLIKEVIPIKRSVNKMSLDDELGVDRHILEKKLINKIAKNPRDKEVYRQLGELYIKMNNYNDAEGCYKQILKIAIRDIDAKRKIERIALLRRSQKK